MNKWISFYVSVNGINTLAVPIKEKTNADFKGKLVENSTGENKNSCLKQPQIDTVLVYSWRKQK